MSEVTQQDTTLDTKNGTPETTPQGNKQVETDLELDRLDRFKFRGQELTPEELDRAILRQQDYTRKTQELAAKSKFQTNLKADLEHVRANPELAERFKKVYPAEYHEYLDLVLSQSEQSGQVDEQDLSEMSTKELMALKKEIQALKAKVSRVDDIDEVFKEREREAADKHLDNIFQKFSDKFPYAIEDTVLNKAQALLDLNRDNPNFKLTEAAWERLFKQSNDEHFKTFEAKYRSQVENQLKKSEKASDSAPGGSAVGRAPKKWTFNDAEQAVIQELTQRKGTR